MVAKSDDLQVKFIPGTRYGGAKQRFLSSPEDERLSKRAKKFVDEGREEQKRGGARLVTFETKEKPKKAVIGQKPEAAATPAPTKGENIRWETRSGKYYVTVNCPQFLRTLKKRMCNPLLNSSSSHLYRSMLSCLQHSKFGTFARFYIIAVGDDSERHETFIKLKGQETEFVLPKSFLQDCSAAIVNQNF